MNCLNRHDQWTKLMQAWHQTGNPIYTQHFNALVIDWVTHLPCRSGVSRAGWDAPGQFDKPCPTGTMESPWRVLEAGIRTVGPWASCFFGTLASGEVSTSARALMLLGFSEHVAVIAGPGREARTPNWQMTQVLCAHCKIVQRSLVICHSIDLPRVNSLPSAHGDFSVCVCRSGPA